MLNLVYKDESDTRAVRIVMCDGEPWFVLSDVCSVLGITNSRMVAERLDAEDKGVSSIDTLGGKQSATIVSEPGLYAVVFNARSNPKTKPFKDWVYKTVLPEIRKTGSYSVNPVPELPTDPLLLALHATAETRKQVLELEVRTTSLEQRLADEPLRSSEIARIYKLGQQLGKTMGGYDKAWRMFKQRFDLASYRDLPRRQLEEGIRFLELQISAYTNQTQERLVTA